MPDHFDYQTLALALCGYTEEASEKILGSDNSDEVIDDQLCDKFNLDYDSFVDLVAVLLKFTPPIQSPISKEVYHAFGRLHNNGTFIAILKQKVEQKGG